MTDLLIGLGFSAVLIALLGKWKAAREVVAVSIFHPLSKSVINIGEDGGGDIQGQEDSDGMPSNGAPPASTSSDARSGGVVGGTVGAAPGGEAKAMSSSAGGYKQEEESYVVSRSRESKPHPDMAVR